MTEKSKSRLIQDTLESLLKDAEKFATDAGFKNIDLCDKSIQANRSKITVYFDADFEYFPASLRFICEIGGEFKFDALTAHEQGLEPIYNELAAVKAWNNF